MTRATVHCDTRAQGARGWEASGTRWLPFVPLNYARAIARARRVVGVGVYMPGWRATGGVATSRNYAIEMRVF